MDAGVPEFTSTRRAIRAGLISSPAALAPCFRPRLLTVGRIYRSSSGPCVLWLWGSMAGVTAAGPITAVLTLWTRQRRRGCTRGRGPTPKREGNDEGPRGMEHFRMLWL